MGDGAAENEAARFDPGNFVDLATGPRLHQFVDRAPERPRIAKQRRDVTEQDPGLGIVGNGANRRFEVVFEDGAGHHRLDMFRAWSDVSLRTVAWIAH